MTLATRRILAASTAIVSVLLAALWTLRVSDTMYRYAKAHLSREIPLSQVCQVGGPRPDSYDRLAQHYYLLLVGGLLVAFGASVVLLMMVPRGGFRIRGIVYMILLAIVLPATLFNYDLGDLVLRPSLQVFLNLILIFLSGTVAMWLSTAPLTSFDLKMLKHLAMTVLLTCGVFAPGLFTLVWLLVKVRMVTCQQSVQIGWDKITGLAGILSAVIAFLNYRRETKKQSDDDALKKQVNLTI